MRIAHVCLAAFYIDGFGYQENILPKIHAAMGHDVRILASTENYVGHTQRTFVEPGRYLNENGIPVDRLAFSRAVPPPLRPKIRAYRGLARLLEDFRPDLVFVHDLQFWDFLAIRRYVRRHGGRVVADCHTDYVNSARGFVSRYILHRIFYRAIIRRVDPVVERYFPTLPARATFLSEVYGLERSKMELLPFGADDTATAGLDRAEVRASYRDNLGIPADATVLVTGGKLDLRKNIHTLIERFSLAKAAGKYPDARLVVFGAPDPEVTAALAKMTVHPHVHLVGWTAAKDIYRAMWSADLAVFPGTHSVLWEEAIGHGLGAVFHRWPGMEHLDLGGNALFIEDAQAATLDSLLEDLLANSGELIQLLTQKAWDRGPARFSFSAIAAQALAERANN